MFGLFKKDPQKVLQQQYRSKLEEAMLAQRNGDIKSFSHLSEEAESLLQQIDQLENTQSQ